MSLTFDDSKAVRSAQALQIAPDKMEEVSELHAVVDSSFEKVGAYAPSPDGPNTNDYLAKVGTYAAAWGPEERKRINRYNVKGKALTEIVREDLQIMEAEAERPRYSLRPGELREVIKTDASGRNVHEFYSDAQTGVKPWMDMFKPQVIRYVSGGSAGIATPDSQPLSMYHFAKHEILPELIEVQRQLAYQDSAEFKVKEAYALAGKEVPEDVLAKLRSAANVQR